MNPYSRLRIFYEPEGVPTGQAPTEPAAAPASTSEPAPAAPAAPPAEATPASPPEDPWKGWWAAQLPADTREANKDEIIAMKGKSLGEVISEHLSTKKTLERAIIPPGKDAKPEEIKAFLAKMNIAETPEGYEFPAELTKGMDKDGAFTKDLQAFSLKTGLTKKQAAAVFEKIVGYAVAGQSHNTEAKQAVRASFDSRLLEAVGKDEAKAKETKDLFKRYLVAIGDKELAKDLSESGMLYNPKFVISMAEYHRRNATDPAYIGGNARAPAAKGKAPEGSQGDYSPEFEAHYGKRK